MERGGVSLQPATARVFDVVSAARGSGKALSRRELMAEANVKSLRALEGQLRKLSQVGLVTIEADAARTVRLVEAEPGEEWFRGDWLQTHSGRRFYPTAPKVEDLDLTDIAHALSHVCRFGGHVREFYSVAQHSMIVSEIVPPELAREGLMHDAAEAYVGDVVRPLKLALPDYKVIEERIERLIAERWGLTFPWPAAIKDADNVALMTERRDLLAVQREWTQRAQPLPWTICPLSPAFAYDLFMLRARDLGLR